MHAVHGATEKQYVCCTLTPNTPCTKAETNCVQNGTGKQRKLETKV